MNHLKKYLLANSVFSAISGLIIIGFSLQIAPLFNLSNTLVLKILGIGLLIFSIFIAIVLSWKGAKKGLVYTITTMDALWVLGSIVILVIPSIQFQLTGIIILSVVAIIVGFFGAKQFQFNK